MADFNEDGNMVMRPASQPALRSLYRAWSLLFFADGWAEPTLGTRWSRSENKVTMYVHTKRKRRKTVKSPMGIGAGAGAYDMKKRRYHV